MSVRVIVKLPPRRRRRVGRDVRRSPLPESPRRAVKSGDTGGCDIRGLPGYAPGVLALPLAAALSLAERKLRGLVDLPDTTLAIVIESSLDDAPLATHQRDALWKAFGLPVFEQLRGWDGTIIARECEVHDGLHFDAKTVIASVDGNNLLVTGRPTGLSAEIIQEPCECGVETPRLRHVGGKAAPREDTTSTPPNVQLKFCVGWMIGIAALLIGGEVLRRGE
jgi:hypothetical protein